MTGTYDRYDRFRGDTEIGIVPYVKVPVKATDFNITYDKKRSRLDLISYEYYGNPDYAWLIMQANPQYGSMEFEIPDKSILRIPYPLDVTIDSYISAIDEYKKLNK